MDRHRERLLGCLSLDEGEFEGLGVPEAVPPVHLAGPVEALVVERWMTTTKIERVGMAAWEHSW
jgi:hypothetical protein